MMVQIKADHMTAGVVLEQDVQSGRWYGASAAPILKYMVGWSLGDITKYAIEKGWKYQLVDRPDAITGDEQHES